MGKKGEADSDQPLTTSRKDDPTNGPLKNRSCTDIICLILFIVTWVAMFGVAIVGFVRGDPRRLLHGVDSAGNRCGYSASVKDRPYLHFFDMTRCVTGLSESLLKSGQLVCNTPQVCVKECPDENAIGLTGPSNQDEKLYCRDGRTLAAHKADTLSLVKAIANSTCAPYYLTSEVILGRCIPTLIDLEAAADALLDPDNATLRDAANNSISGGKIIEGINLFARWLNLRNIGSKIWNDFEKTYLYTLSGLGLVIAACFLYIFLIAIIIGPMVYISMFGTLGLLIYGAYVSFVHYDKLKSGLIVRPASANSFLDEYRYQTDTYLALGIIAASGAGIMLLLMLFMIGRIRFAVAIIKEASKAMFAIKSTFLFPLLPAILQCILFVYFVGVGLFLVTSSKEQYSISLTTQNNTTSIMVNTSNGTTMAESGSSCTPNNVSASALVGLAECVFSGYDDDKVLLGFQILHFIGWLWTANWISALGQCVLAGTFASYFWTKKSKSLPTFPILASLGRTLFYHTGSLAFGAAIITIIQIIRAILVYLETKLKHHNDKPAIKFILKCLGCLFLCVEKLIKFINKNAYIEIAVFGYNFCKAARTAFSLLLRNILRTAAVNNITAFILLLGRLVISVSTAVASYQIFESLNTRLDLHYFLAPVIVLTFAAFLLSGIFLDTYDMGVDTIYLCALEDLERHNGSPESPYYMSKSLQKILKVKNEKIGTTEEKIPMNEK